MSARSIMSKLATKWFSWGAIGTRRFPARNWPIALARLRGKLSPGLAAVSGASLYRTTTGLTFVCLSAFTFPMFQIIFNELSAAEISALPKKLQLNLLAQFQIL